jgi:hypothetical protein
MTRSTKREPTAADVPLFGEPPAVVLPPLKTQRLGALATWTRYRGAHHACDHCVQRIHEMGADKAPPPLPASQKRTGPNDVLLLCNLDAIDMKVKDDEAARRRDALIASNEALRRSFQRGARRR